MIINLTQHQATTSQTEAGLIDLEPGTRARLCALITIDEEILEARPELFEEILEDRARRIVAEFVWPFVADCIRETLVGLPDPNTLGLIDIINFRRTLGEVRFMVGGMPALMGYLIPAIRRAGGVPVEALSTRKVEETTLPDGTTRKTAVFDHIRFREIPA